MALVTTQSKPFLQLVDLQQQSLDALNKIKDSVTLSAEQQTADTQRQSLEQLKKILDTQQDHFKLAKKSSADMTNQMANMNEKMKKWKTWGDKARDLKQGVSDTFSPAKLKDTMLKALNVGGMMNQKIQANDYIKRQKDLGLDKGRSPKDLKADAADYAKQQRQAMLAQQKIDRLKARGSSDDDIKRSPVGKALYQQRDSAASNVKSLDAGNKMGGNVAYKSDSLTKLPSDKGQVAQSTTDVLAEQQSAKENQMESLRALGDQTNLLQQIAQNTALMAGNKPSSAGGGESSGGGGGLMAGVAVGMKALGSGFAGLGKGLGKGLSSALTGLAEGLAALVIPATLLIPAMLALGAALNLAAPAFSALAPVVIKLADVFGNIFMKALQMLPDVIRAVGDVVMGVVSTISDAIINVVNTVTDSIDRLANIDGSNLMSVGAGLLAVAGGLAAFGAANVLAGVGNLVSGFLSAVSGQATPVEQLMMLADKSQGMNDTAAGISGIGDAMKKFADISPDTMQAVNDFPWVRATAFVAAGGAMAVQGAKVYNQSKNVEDEKAAVDGQKNQPVAANTSMAVQNNNTTNTTVKPNVRNQESSQSRYLASRY